MNKYPVSVYLDNAATTILDPRVAEVIRETGEICFGNASSIHSAGVNAKEMIGKSRETLASLLSCQPGEIVFTASGTEANNLALKGVAFANSRKGRHIIVTAIEHDCILRTADWLTGKGFRITVIPVGGDGVVNPDEIHDAITPETLMVSVMHVNNEIGTIQPVSAIGKICRERDVYFHTDACQSFGKIPVKVQELNADLVTVNAHKIHGPKGVGALYIRQGVNLEPLLHGGGQEGGMRSSTENTPGIAGFAKAVEIADKSMDIERYRISSLQKRIIDHLEEKVEGIYFNGSMTERIPYNLNFCIEGFEGEGIRLQLLLDEAGVCVSTGSACSSNDGGNPSHVLQAIGLDPLRARGGIRISLGRFTTEAETDRFLEILPGKVQLLNRLF